MKSSTAHTSYQFLWEINKGTKWPALSTGYWEHQQNPGTPASKTPPETDTRDKAYVLPQAGYSDTDFTTWSNDKGEAGQLSSTDQKTLAARRHACCACTDCMALTRDKQNREGFPFVSRRKSCIRTCLTALADTSCHVTIANAHSDVDAEAIYHGGQNTAKLYMMLWVLLNTIIHPPIKCSRVNIRSA